MARITIEDCTERVPNRFHLVQMASIRTKQLKKGARALVQSEGNKEVVIALREIAAGFIQPDYAEPSRRAASETQNAGHAAALAPTPRAERSAVCRSRRGSRAPARRRRGAAGVPRSARPGSGR